MNITDNIYKDIKEKFITAKTSGIPYMDLSSDEIINTFNLQDKINDVCNLMKRLMTEDDFCVDESCENSEHSLTIRYYLKDK
ncbi:hypothetical protein [Clostridium tarantellae]|uniref:Uncharacterized protein n=1 Tax=Clostridium tarantellae TaxID=39493 RepID=A0A6I1ML66_9CLOT|nr:hypothetical protein [Clostridium tarantellae]MPQ44246.1 hypothetical protein [Clostridium tarantellae]